MTKIDIISGFLGAGKTTLIKKLIAEAYKGEKVVLIENEFGEIGIDGGFMKDAGIEITEMNSGCICCSLVGDFAEALKKVLSDFAPDRIVIEPSGVGKLSDVVRAVSGIESDDVKISARTVVADATKCRIYMKNFGEFYNNQIESATAIILSRTAAISAEKLDAAIRLIREHNEKAVIVTTPWDALDGKAILDAMESGNASLADELFAQDDICPECGCHHDHHHDEDEHDHCCHHHDEEDEHCHHDEDGHHHHHDDEEEEHGHCCHHHDDEHDHHDDGDEHCHHHGDEHGHHHHDHGDECGCGHHDHHDHGHHHHHADEVFTSWGANTAKKFTPERIAEILTAFTESDDYGMILRAKGIVGGEDGAWIHFDYVPGEQNIRNGSADVTGKLCVIGSKLNEEKIAELFGVTDYERN